LKCHTGKADGEEVAKSEDLHLSNLNVWQHRARYPFYECLPRHAHIW